MKLHPHILRLARQEVDQHLADDLRYAVMLHRFLHEGLDKKEYLYAEYGFKQFLNDYGVGRTLHAGDAAKLKILKVIREFPFHGSPVEIIMELAHVLQKKKLSSGTAASGPGLPRSFASKLLYVYRPDQVIPFDSYVRKSLEVRTGQKLTDLSDYFHEAEAFRQTHFAEHKSEVQRARRKYESHILPLLSTTVFDPDKMLSWKFTDKYLWCEEYARRNSV